MKHIVEGDIEPLQRGTTQRGIQRAAVFPSFSLQIAQRIAALIQSSAQTAAMQAAKPIPSPPPNEDREALNPNSSSSSLPTPNQQTQEEWFLLILRAAKAVLLREGTQGTSLQPSDGNRVAGNRRSSSGCEAVFLSLGVQGSLAVATAALHDCLRYHLVRGRQIEGPAFILEMVSLHSAAVDKIHRDSRIPSAYTPGQRIAKEDPVLVAVA